MENFTRKFSRTGCRMYKETVLRDKSKLSLNKPCLAPAKPYVYMQYMQYNQFEELF